MMPLQERFSMNLDINIFAHSVKEKSKNKARKF